MKKTCEVEKRPQFTPFLLVPKNKLPISKTELKKRKKIQWNVETNYFEKSRFYDLKSKFQRYFDGNIEALDFYTVLAADLIIERAQNLKAKPENPENVPFGHVFTDHMLEIDYDANNGGWGKPRISEFGDLNLVRGLYYWSNHSLYFVKNCIWPKTRSYSRGRVQFKVNSQ